MSFIKYLKEGLEGHTCPLDNRYGGVPTGGGYSANTEYEIGAQTIAEAAHCILGSLVKIKTKMGLDNYTDFESYKDTEREHIEEEFGIIKNAINDYSRPLYIGRVWREDSPYAIESIESIKNNSPKLREIAQSALKRINIPSPMKEVAEASYKVLIALANGMENSVKNVTNRPKRNGIDSMLLREAVDDLGLAINELFSDSGE